MMQAIYTYTSRPEARTGTTLIPLQLGQQLLLPKCTGFDWITGYLKVYPVFSIHAFITASASAIHVLTMLVATCYKHAQVEGS